MRNLEGLKKGRGWNKGLKGTHFSPKTEFKKGMITWCKGKKLTEEHINNLSISHLGKKQTLESNIKRSKSLKEKHKELEWGFKKGVSSNMKGKRHLDSSRLMIKQKRKLQVFPIKDTSIEVKVQNLLKELKIEFLTHQYMNIEHGYQCDILIPVQEGINRKTIIECFGTYWHKYPLGNPLDTLRCNELRKQSWRVLVLWENEIKLMQVSDLKNELGILEGIK